MKHNQQQKQYQLERRLRKKLLNSNKKSRRRLYGQVYDEFFEKFPLPTASDKSLAKSRFVSGQVNLLKHFLKQDSTFLDIGTGDSSLAIAISKTVKKVYAIDVSDKLAGNPKQSQNFQFTISDGIKIPTPKNSVDLAFSSQVIEHMHPDDALDHLKNVNQALAPGGLYILITPNRLYGPHDISKFFNAKAKGLHLKEYTVSELYDLFHKAGFSNLRLFIEVKGHVFSFPTYPVRILETVLSMLPHPLKRKISSLKPLVLLLGILMIAKK